MKTATAAKDLFAEITKGFPPPWNLEYHKQGQFHPRQYVSKVVASNGECPITLETYSGDGDAFNLGSEGAEALVKFVNAMHGRVR